MILNPFKGKNIFITGASKGIGLAMAREFATHGANLVLIARDKDTLQAAKREVEKRGNGVRVLAYACDVTDSDTLKDYIHMARYELGSIDGIIANSGYGHPGNFHEIALEDFDAQIDTNVRGVIHTIHHAMPYLLENDNGGFVAITSSPAAHAGIFGFSAYGPTKAAVSNLADVLRNEYRDRNIRVHLLLPPNTDTPGHRAEAPLYPPETQAVLEGSPLLGSEYVAKKFVAGIANHRKAIAVGGRTRMFLIAIRHCPFLFDWYSRYKVQRARRSSLEDKASDGSEVTDSEAQETERR